VALINFSLSLSLSLSLYLSISSLDDGDVPAVVMFAREGYGTEVVGMIQYNGDDDVQT
jgi:hypothetical protein